MSDVLKGLIYKKTKDNITTAYKAYAAQEEDAESQFYSALFEFALSKISHAVYGSALGDKTPEDHAQEVCVYVWQNLPSFKGEPDSFYSWLHRICYTKGVSAFNEYIELDGKREELFIEQEAEDEDERIIDNPSIYAREKFDIPARSLPGFIKGIDAEICDWIREGLNYAQIASKLHLTEAAVKLRINRMRNKIKEIKNVKSAAA